MQKRKNLTSSEVFLLYMFHPSTSSGTGSGIFQKKVRVIALSGCLIDFIGVVDGAMQPTAFFAFHGHFNDQIGGVDDVA